MEETLKCVFLSERSQLEEVSYHLIPTVVYSGEGKTKETVKRPVAARDWRVGEGMNRQGIEDFRAENSLSDATMMNSCHYTFVQSIGCIIQYQKRTLV